MRRRQRRKFAGMNLLHEPPPAGFDGIAKTFAMARQIPTTNRLALKIGLANDGVLFAQGELDGYRQVSFFSDHLRSLGYREHLLGSQEEMFGCDMLFAAAPPPQRRAGDGDPSFIRKSPVELWPVRG
ncbi:MAG: hypothetical protein JWQ76_5319 [Ramlibacter sp.]|nr:hypothetical protein [Ramlibacter sp.]